MKLTSTLLGAVLATTTLAAPVTLALEGSGAAPVARTRIEADGKSHPIDIGLTVNKIHNEGNVACTVIGADGAKTQVPAGKEVNVVKAQKQTSAVCK